MCVECWPVALRLSAFAFAHAMDRARAQPPSHVREPWVRSSLQSGRGGGLSIIRMVNFEILMQIKFV